MLKIVVLYFSVMQKYPSGSRGSPAKGVVRETVAWVQIPSSAPRRRKAKFLKGCLLDNLFSLTPATPFFHKSFVCKIFAEALFFARYFLVAGCFLLSGYNIFSIFLVFSQFIMQEVVNLLTRIYNFAAFQTLSYDCTSNRVKLQVLQNIFR